MVLDTIVISHQLHFDVIEVSVISYIVSLSFSFLPFILITSHTTAPWIINHIRPSWFLEENIKTFSPWHIKLASWRLDMQKELLLLKCRHLSSLQWVVALSTYTNIRTTREYMDYDISKKHQNNYNEHQNYNVRIIKIINQTAHASHSISNFQ